MEGLNGKLENNFGKNTCSQLIQKNAFLNRLYSAFSIFLEIHVVLLTVLWELACACYRYIVPIAKKSVDGEKVLITGAANGLGRELALLYAAEGSTVICWDVDERKNEETVKLINSMGHRQAYAYTCDVTDYNKVTEVCTKIQNEIGDITILINNAGILHSKPFLQTSKSVIEKTINVNVLSHCWTLQAVLPTMLKNNHGHIVAVSSLCGIDVIPNLSIYCCSKHAVRGLMTTLQQELEKQDDCQIKTTTVYPFVMDTDMVKSLSIRFPWLTPVLKKEQVAKYIMSAQRRNVVETTIPGSLYCLFLLLRSLPYKAKQAIIDFTGINVYSDP